MCMYRVCIISASQLTESQFHAHFTISDSPHTHLTTSPSHTRLSIPHSFHTHLTLISHSSHTHLTQPNKAHTHHSTPHSSQHLTLISPPHHVTLISPPHLSSHSCPCACAGYIPSHTQAVDLILVAVEASLWTAQQFAQDLMVAAYAP